MNECFLEGFFVILESNKKERDFEIRSKKNFLVPINFNIE